MKFRFFCVLIVFMMFTGCNCKKIKCQPRDWKQPIDIPISNIVYNTLETGPDNGGRMHEVLGFYNMNTGEITTIDLKSPLMTPFYLNSDTIIAINKLGELGFEDEFSGYPFIFTKNNYITCNTPESTGWWMQPYQGNVLIDSITGINLISSKDCSLIRSVLLHDQFAGSKGMNGIGPFSLSSDGTFIIVESDDKLYQINLTNLEVFDYHKAGMHPAISPDQKLVVYDSLRDGIHIMDINGENDRLIANFESNTYDAYGGERGIPPRPRWSSDGKKLTYHKCTALGIANGCTDINDYSIYIYNFVSQTESKIIDGGLNPSWR